MRRAHLRGRAAQHSSNNRSAAAPRPTLADVCHCLLLLTLPRGACLPAGHNTMEAKTELHIDLPLQVKPGPPVPDISRTAYNGARALSSECAAASCGWHQLTALCGVCGVRARLQVAGLVVGKQGIKIKQIKQRSKAQVPDGTPCGTRARSWRGTEPMCCCSC